MKRVSVEERTRDCRDGLVRGTVHFMLGPRSVSGDRSVLSVVWGNIFRKILKYFREVMFLIKQSVHN